MNWNKIAEAFGRAVCSPKVTETEFNRFANLAVRSPETEKSFIKGIDEGEDASSRMIGVDDLDPDADDKLERAFDAEVDAMTDRALLDDFANGFEEALNKRRGKIRDAMGDARDADEAADAGIDDIRKTAIEMLKSGRDIGDVLRILRGE